MLIFQVRGEIHLFPATIANFDVAHPRPDASALMRTQQIRGEVVDHPQSDLHIPPMKHRAFNPQRHHEGLLLVLPFTLVELLL